MNKTAIYFVANVNWVVFSVDKTEIITHWPYYYTKALWSRIMHNWRCSTRLPPIFIWSIFHQYFSISWSRRHLNHRNWFLSVTQNGVWIPGGLGPEAIFHIPNISWLMSEGWWLLWSTAFALGERGGCNCTSHQAQTGWRTSFSGTWTLSKAYYHANKHKQPWTRGKMKSSFMCYCSMLLMLYQIP